LLLSLFVLNYLFHNHIAEFLSVFRTVSEIADHFHKLTVVMLPLGIEMTAEATAKISDKQFFRERFVHVAVVFPQHNAPD
jgi:hypothetical protein